MESKETEELQQIYQEYVKEITPKHNLPINMIKAFLLGGSICTIGQVILHIGQANGLDQESAASWCSLLLVLASIILTGLNLYQKLAKFGGAGALVPITGFANGVGASAIEFQAEGEVFGVGSQIFMIAGPVILYGVFTSWVLGLIYWLLTIIGIL
jgi:stage V sporulation protein AC